MDSRHILHAYNNQTMQAFYIYIYISKPCNEGSNLCNELIHANDGYLNNYIQNINFKMVWIYRSEH